MTGLKQTVTDQCRWLAVAREAMIRAGQSPSAADKAIEGLTGDWRDTVDHQQEAWDLVQQIGATPDTRREEAIENAARVALDTLHAISREGIDMDTFNEGGIGHNAVSILEKALDPEPVKA